MKKSKKDKSPTVPELQTTISCLSIELAAEKRLRFSERDDHTKFLNELRTRAFGLKELPLDMKPEVLQEFRSDLLGYLSKFVEAATRRVEPVKEPEPATKKQSVPLTA